MFTKEFKHEVCQFYEHHTLDQTRAKYKVSVPTIIDWRKKLGYRNKFFGYNMQTDKVAPAAVRRNYRVMKSENGDLKVELINLKGQLEDLKEENRLFKQRLEGVAQCLNMQ